MVTLLALFAGGLGAVARYLVAGAVQERADSRRPWGTAVVNVSGALILGLLAGLLRAEVVPPEVLMVAGGGLLGAYTTFSTWMVETVRLADAGGRAGALAALANVVWPLAIGLGAATGGYVVGGWI